MEEGDRIGYVDEDGDVEFGGGGPDEIEARVVYGDEGVMLVVDGEAEGFPDFEALRSSCDLLAEGGGGVVGEAVGIGGP